MICWKCGKETGEGSLEKLPFRAECPHCRADLHVCKQCKFYQPGKRNDCMIPDTDFVADREKMNYCEEFKAATNLTPGKQGPTKDDIEKRLFGD